MATAPGTSGGNTNPPHKLTTTIKDPASDDVWVIETIQGENESLTEFVTRHRAAVQVVHRILKGS